MALVGTICYILAEKTLCVLNLAKYIKFPKKAKVLENEQKKHNDSVNKERIGLKSRDNDNDEMKVAISNNDNGENDVNDDTMILQKISFDLKDVKNKLNEISQDKTNDSNTNIDIKSDAQYFTQLHQISNKQQELCQNINKIGDKCESDKAANRSRILEIDKTIESLLDEKKQLTQSMNQTEHMIVECQNKLNMCQSLAEKYLELIESPQFEKNLDNFEKEWPKWNHENILIWFKTILTQKSIGSNTGTEDEKNEQVEIQDDDKKMSTVNNSDIDNVDWPLVSSNLQIRDWDGDHLLICKEKQLIKLGFNNDANVRKHLLFSIKRITKRYPPKESS